MNKIFAPVFLVVALINVMPSFADSSGDERIADEIRRQSNQQHMDAVIYGNQQNCPPCDCPQEVNTLKVPPGCKPIFEKDEKGMIQRYWDDDSKTRYHFEVRLNCVESQ